MDQPRDHQSGVWMCRIDENEIGPLSTRQLAKLANFGTLQPIHLIRHLTTDQWTTADTLPELRQVFALKCVAQDLGDPPTARVVPTKISDAILNTVTHGIAECMKCRRTCDCDMFWAGSGRVVNKNLFVQFSDEYMDEMGLEWGDETLITNSRRYVDLQYREYVNLNGYWRYELLTQDGYYYINCEIVPKRPMPLCRMCQYRLGLINISFTSLIKLFLFGIPLLLLGVVVPILLIIPAIISVGIVIFIIHDFFLVALALAGWRKPLGRLCVLRCALKNRVSY